jgi:hypothetical protein
MKVSSIITILGVSIILFYTIITILKFYGINESVYGTYLLFYIFIILSILVLPSDYPNVL